METGGIGDLQKVRNHETNLHVIVNKPLMQVLFGWFGANVSLNTKQIPMLQLDSASKGKDQSAFIRAAVWGVDKNAPDYQSSTFKKEVGQAQITSESLLGNTHFLANIVREYSIQKTDENTKLLIESGLSWMIGDEKFVDHMLVRRMDRMLNGETDPEDIIISRRQAAFTKALSLAIGTTMSLHQLTDIVANSNELVWAAALLNTRASGVVVDKRKITNATAKPASKFMNNSTNCVFPTTQTAEVVRTFGKASSTYESKVFDIVNPDLNMCLAKDGKVCKRIGFCRRPESDELETYAAEVFYKFLKNEF
jgi:hypothetical protein